MARASRANALLIAPARYRTRPAQHRQHIRTQSAAYPLLISVHVGYVCATAGLRCECVQRDTEREATGLGAVTAPSRIYVWDPIKQTPRFL